jgi:hypothetical protein
VGVVGWEVVVMAAAGVGWEVVVVVVMVVAVRVAVTAGAGTCPSYSSLCESKRHNTTRVSHTQGLSQHAG